MKSNRAWLVGFLGLALTVPAQAGLQDGLIAHYSFDGDADNKAGPAPNGVVSGATLAPDRFGHPNAAYAFDGNDDYVEVSNTAGVFNLTSAWTVACWVKPASAATDGRDDPLVWKTAVGGDYNEDTFGVSWGAMTPYGPTGNRFFSYLERASDGEDFGATSLTHPVGDWSHVVGTYDGNYLSVYVDGNQEQTSDIGSIVAYTGPAPLRIGNFQNTSHIYGPSHIGAFDGVIDEVYIYSRALTSTEVQDLYAIPEPATLCLLLMGIAGVFRGKRRATR